LIFGISLSTFTTVHVALSLAGIAAGVLVLLRPCASTKALSLNALFLATTSAACVTGLLFMVEFPRFRLGHTLGTMSLVVIVPTAIALYRHRLAGPWCGVFLAGVTVALYLNAFIGVMQAFAKIGFLPRLDHRLRKADLRICTQLFLSRGYKP
jgi:hypothetical protein